MYIFFLQQLFKEITGLKLLIIPTPGFPCFTQFTSVNISSFICRLSIPYPKCLVPDMSQIFEFSVFWNVCIDFTSCASLIQMIPSLKVSDCRTFGFQIFTFRMLNLQLPWPSIIMIKGRNISHELNSLGGLKFISLSITFCILIILWESCLKYMICTSFLKPQYQHYFLMSTHLEVDLICLTPIIPSNNFPV